MTDIQTNKYNNLLNNIGEILSQGRIKAVKSVNSILVETNWYIGQYIVEFEQGGNEKAEYGSVLLNRLSKDLHSAYGKGFSKSNIYLMRLFYLKFEKFQTVSGKLSWSHYAEIVTISDDLERSFYEKQCIQENWSVRELKRQKETALFQRLALSKDKKGVLELAQKGQIIETAEDIIKQPYIFDFLPIKEGGKYSENDLENSLINNLSHFLLELGKGFTYVGQQYRITIDNTHHFVDLVFYHRILKCFVLIDLKLGKVNHQDIGQMNFYINYFNAEENTTGDKPAIGIVLGADKNDILVEYATAGISNQLFVSEYQLHLPNKEVLQKEIEFLLEQCNKQKPFNNNKRKEK